MNRPTLEVADIIRQHGKDFIARNRHRLSWQQLKVLRAIERCRTAALGGHRDRCPRCGPRAISYNSCRNRHCPKCLTHARDRWLADREKELLNVGYFHVVFTLPEELSELTLQNQKVIYQLLFRTSAATLLEVAADPQHLGAQIGFLSVLHTWGQNLHHHPHVHSVVPAGGLAPDGTRWIHSGKRFFLPVKVLSRVFRGKFAAGLKRAFRKGKLVFSGRLKALATPEAFHSFLRALFRKQWVVYAKPPFGGPKHVLHYLARYTHRVAISNHRLLGLADGQVSFRWKDYAHGARTGVMSLGVDEFLRRFLLHVLPKGLVRIRFFGFLANRHRRSQLTLCQRLLPCAPVRQPGSAQVRPETSGWRCPVCGSTMIVVERLSAQQLAALTESYADTS
jgi:hypothetical protein